jgi:hypothetical protein
MRILVLVSILLASCNSIVPEVSAADSSFIELRAHQLTEEKIKDLVVFKLFNEVKCELRYEGQIYKTMNREAYVKKYQNQVDYYNDLNLIYKSEEFIYLDSLSQRHTAYIFYKNSKPFLQANVIVKSKKNILEKVLVVDNMITYKSYVYRE